MTLTNRTTLEGSQFIQFAGFICIEDIIEETNLEVPEAILSDLGGLTEEYVAYTLWSAYTRVNSFNPSFIPSFKGNPQRYKFGSINHGVRQTITSYHYINTELQGFPRQSCMISPPIFLSIPYESSLIFPQPDSDILVPTVANGYLTGWAQFGSRDSHRENSGVYGATSVRLCLERSVNVNLTIAYFGGYEDISDEPLNATYFNI